MRWRLPQRTRPGSTSLHEQVLSVSTGVIGWSLPVAKMIPVIDSLERYETDAATFCPGDYDDRPLSQVGVEHNQRWCNRPRVRQGRRYGGTQSCHDARFFPYRRGCESGASPKCTFVRVVERTFNTISIDSDQSTSDMVLLLANGSSGGRVCPTRSSRRHSSRWRSVWQKRSSVTEKVRRM